MSLVGALFDASAVMLTMILAANIQPEVWDAQSLRASSKKGIAIAGEIPYAALQGRAG